jgi:hypothetical protein
VHELSQGQPWLVNALCREAVEKLEKNRQAPITKAIIEQAKEDIIINRYTHIDSLLARLHEPRVQRIIEPMIIGENTSQKVLSDDFLYVISLGLIRRENGKYGHLDMQKIMRNWQDYWREHGHLGAAGLRYKEAGPHLMMMAYLQRIINGGGKIHREYALGNYALDLLIEYNNRRYAIEIKLARDAFTRKKAKLQIAHYAELANLDEGWLVMFDRSKKKPWEKKIKRHRTHVKGKLIHIIGC